MWIDWYGLHVFSFFKSWSRKVHKPPWKEIKWVFKGFLQQFGITQSVDPLGHNLSIKGVWPSQTFTKHATKARGWKWIIWEESMDAIRVHRGCFLQVFCFVPIFKRGCAVFPRFFWGGVKVRWWYKSLNAPELDHFRIVKNRNVKIATMEILKSNRHHLFGHAVDGRNAKKPPAGCVVHPVNSGVSTTNLNWWSPDLWTINSRSNGFIDLLICFV